MQFLPGRGLQIVTCGAAIPVQVAGCAAGAPDGLGAGTTGEQALPAVSKTMLLPTSRSPLGPRGKARWRRKIYRVDRFDRSAYRIDLYDPSILNVAAYLRDRDIESLGARVPHRLLGASGPGKEDCLWLAEYAVDETLIKVPNGGVSALLITRSSRSCGSNASSSARLPPPVLMELAGVTKLAL